MEAVTEERTGGGRHFDRSPRRRSKISNNVAMEVGDKSTPGLKRQEKAMEVGDKISNDVAMEVGDKSTPDRTGERQNISNPKN
jgi:hypothetical protein